MQWLPELEEERTKDIKLMTLKCSGKNSAIPEIDFFFFFANLFTFSYSDGSWYPTFLEANNLHKVLQRLAFHPMKCFASLPCNGLTLPTAGLLESLKPLAVSRLRSLSRSRESSKIM